MALINDLVRVFIATASDPLSTSPTYTEVSNISASERPLRGVTQVQLSYGRDRGAGGKFRPREATITFNNNDGDFDTANPGSVFGSNLKRNKPVRIGVSDDSFGTASWSIFTGFITDVIPSGDALTGQATIIAHDMLRILEEFDVASLVRPVEFSGVRVAAILDEAGIPAGLRGTIHNGTVLMPAATVAGSALSLLQECARAEYGFLYVHPNGGDIYFLERYALTTGVVSAWSTRLHSFTASGSSGATKVAFGDVRRNLGLRAVTRVSASREGSDKTFEYDTTASNNPKVTPSDGPYGLSLVADADVEKAAEAWHKGWDYDGERVDAVPVRVYPGNSNAVTAVHVGYWEPMARVEVQLTPAGFTTDFNYEARIEGVDHTIGVDYWDAVVHFSPYTTQWVTDSADFYNYGDALGTSEGGG